MLLQDIHAVSVSHKKVSVNIIDPLISSADHGLMIETTTSRPWLEPPSEFAREGAPAWNER